MSLKLNDHKKDFIVEPQKKSGGKALNTDSHTFVASEGLRQPLFPSQVLWLLRQVIKAC